MRGFPTPSEVARNIALGIGASFVASGFRAWGLLQAKELIMAIADWIRQHTARQQEKWLQERLRDVREEMVEEVRQEVLRR